MRLVFPALALAIVLGFGSVSLAGQSVEWVTIETDKNVLSVSLPKDFIVTAESERFFERKTLYAFADGVQIEFSAVKSAGLPAKANLARVRLDKDRDPKILDFEFEGLPGKYITYKKSGWQTKILVASNDWYYRVELSAESAESEAVLRVLNSIRIKGKQFLSARGMNSTPPSEIIALKSLKESPEIDEALKQKQPKYEAEVFYEPLAEFKPCPANSGVRPAVLAESLKPAMTFSPMNVKEGGEIRVQYDLHADGRVGDIRIYSDVDRSVLRGYADAAKKLRFLPAQKAGVAVDWCDTLWSAFDITISTRIITVR